MKKMIIMLAVFALTSLVVGSNAMAFSVSGLGELKMGSSAVAAGNSALTIGLSPKVFGLYYTDGDAPGTAQWFAIGAAHPGGNEMYAGAQNLTNTYKQKFEAGTELTEALFALPTQASSAEDWSAGGWRP